jgi:hypothetical protein
VRRAGHRSVERVRLHGVAHDHVAALMQGLHAPSHVIVIVVTGTRLSSAPTATVNFEFMSPVACERILRFEAPLC